MLSKTIDIMIGYEKLVVKIAVRLGYIRVITLKKIQGIM